MKKFLEKQQIKIAGYVVLAILILGILFVFLHLFSSKDFSYEICCALIGTIITIAITAVLLEGQSSADETKDKNIKIYENKLDVYSQYIQQMWETICTDEELDEKEWNEIRKQTFGKLVFYLDADAIKELKSCIGEIDQQRRDNKIQGIRIGFAKITKLLTDDIASKKRGDASCYVDLFNKFGIDISEIQSDKEEHSACAQSAAQPDTESGVSETSVIPIPTPTPVPTEQPSISPIYQLGNSVWSHGFWHFCALNMSVQMEHLNALVAIEYGEIWRTNNIRKVKEGDLIFLFAKGGCGYYGVFRAKNVEGTNSPALVFEVDYNKYKEQEYQENKDAEYKKYGEAFDIYNAFADRATAISAINVETVYFNKNGIGNPVATRRPTIVPFLVTEDRYALLNAFDKAMSENK